ncbi:MAG TPA: glycoside hydrolase family 2 TIM barrel-domain containing protein [Bacteroidota bacterium]|nr:glycoside hydrolase family 2 TIM barrel-domain containing protein [Bacteroidota bacterium]
MLFCIIFPTPGYSGFTPLKLTFFENGQPTRLGSDVGMFADTPTRRKLDLAGTWQYSINGKDWSAITVPSAYDFTEKVSFRRTFEITSQMLDAFTFQVVIYGINYQSEVIINGNFVGRHMGGYSSFLLPISQNILQVGAENSITIFVDNELTPKSTLPLRQNVGGWRTYGGIFRDIYILAVPHISVGEIRLKTAVSQDGKPSKVIVSSEIHNRGMSFKGEAGVQFTYQSEVYDKLTNELAGKSNQMPFIPITNKSVSVNSEIEMAKSKLWSPETPDLYILKCRILKTFNKEISVVDEYIVDFGFKDIQWKDGRLYLNGNFILLKGILWHEDHSTFGPAMTYELLERDVALMKIIGVNLVRFLYPPHPYMLNLCDRYGILVMEEIPLVGVPAAILGEEYYQDLAVSYIREMVARDRHHVSVLAWGIGNEFEPSAPNQCEYVNSMRNIIRSIDDHPIFFTSWSAEDPCFEHVDMIAINNHRREVKEFREALLRWKSNNRTKPIIVSRYGEEVEPGNRNGYSDPLSMESQARTLMLFYEAIKDSKIAGGIFWSFNDWRTDRPALSTNSRDPYLQTMGIVSYDRDKRVAFEMTRALYNGEKVQALPVGNYAASAPIIFVIAGLIVLISFAFYYNSNRRFRDAVNRCLFRTYNFFADVRDQRILTYLHTIILAMVISVTWAIILSSVFTYFRESLFLDNILSQFLADPVKEWFIRLVWNPPEFILIVSVMICLKLFLLSLLIRLLAMMVKTHVYFYHAFSITTWSMLPFIVFIPLSMILFRLMENDFYIIPVFILLSIVTLWVLFRLLKGISIIYDVFPMKIYIIGLLFLFITTAGLFSYYDYTQSTSTYVKYMMQAMRSSSKI